MLRKVCGYLPTMEKLLECKYYPYRNWLSCITLCMPALPRANDLIIYTICFDSDSLTSPNSASCIVGPYSVHQTAFPNTMNAFCRRVLNVLEAFQNPSPIDNPLSISYYHNDALQTI